ncbi:MAG TPA: HEAT repeat domain-containing protein [Myxococcales bacterium]|nr:HEAT repeat domain-containing protein [Myxococcales bacterium]
MRKLVLCLGAAFSCAGPSANAPPMTPSPSRSPNSSAAAAMAPSQPIQQFGMTTIPQPPPTAEKQRAHIQLLLEGSETPPPSEQLLAQGPGVFHALDAIFHDPTAKLSTRGRALASMANLDDDRGFAELRGVLASPSTTAPQPFFARTAIDALARAQGARAVSAIADALTWKDPGVREAAADALGRIGGPDARAALQARLALESDPGVRAALERALAKATP